MLPLVCFSLATEIKLEQIHGQPLNEHDFMVYVTAGGGVRPILCPRFFFFQKSYLARSH